MHEGERVKLLRKEKLHMTMEQFGEVFGITKAAISRIESGAVALTDQNRKSICREFNVREEWLRTGEGNPFIEKTRDQLIEEMVDEIMSRKPEDFRRRFVRALAALDADGCAALERFIDQIVEVNEEEPQPVAAPQNSSDLTPDEREMLRQYREKKNQAGGSSVSSAG